MIQLLINITEEELMALRDQPYIPLMIRDYLGDEKLRECKPSSVGVYSFLLCLLHKTDDYGCLLLNQNDKQTPNTTLNFARKIAKHLPYNEDVIKEALEDLLFNKVLHLDIGEVDKLWQKRMVRDNSISLIKAEAGSKGGKVTQFAKAKIEAKEEANTPANYVNAIVNVNEDVFKALKESFEKFWKIYDKKIDRPRCENYWLKKTKLKNNKVIKEAEHDKIFNHVLEYVNSTPDKKYRKDPGTYLYNSSWENEIIKNNSIQDKKIFTDMEVIEYCNKNNITISYNNKKQITGLSDKFLEIFVKTEDKTKWLKLK